MKKSYGGKKEVEIVFSQAPGLEKGITVLQGARTKDFHRVLTQEIGYSGSKAIWVDAGDNASTYKLSNHLDRESMDRVKIGRAFTPHQHYSLVMRLENLLDKDTEVLLLPEITSLYTEGQVREWESEKLFQEIWEELGRLKQVYNLKIVVSVGKSSLLDFRVRQGADKLIEAGETSQGRRYSSQDYSQRAYATMEGFQTTLFYWRDKISADRKLSKKEVV